MITEDYVSFEVAKLLKDKGFREITCGFYWEDDTGILMVSNPINHNGSINVVAAPSHGHAMKWLREVRDIEITIDYDNDVDCLEYERWGFTWYANPHYEVDLNTFATYEEACEAAIKYCLENLI